MPPIIISAVGSMKNASSVQKTRSHGHTIRWPPPMQPPCTAAIVGFATDWMSRISSAGGSTDAPSGAGCGSRRFAPTQKCRPVACMTTTCESSCFARCHASWNSTWNAPSYMFTGERSSVRTVMSPSRS